MEGGFIEDGGIEGGLDGGTQGFGSVGQHLVGIGR